MPTQNPTVISASLDDSKLRNSIKSLVDFVQEQTKAMATSFDSSMSAIKKSMSDFPESVQRARQANRDLAESFESVGRAIRNAKSSGIGSYPAAGGGVFESEKKAIDEFNRKYKEAVDKAKAEQERLNQIAEMGRRSAEQSMRPRERWDVRQDSEINRLRMTIHGLELDLKQLDNTSIKQAQRQFAEYDELIKQARLEVEKLRQTPIADRNQQNAVIQQLREYENEIKRLQAEQQKIDPLSFNAERRSQITQQLQAARDEVRRLGTEMENVALIEERVARGAEQIMARQKRGKAGSAEYIDSMGQKSLITFKNEADLREKIYQIEKSAVEEKQKQLQVQKQQQQAASQYSEEIRKQAKLIRQSHQFQRTGMASYSASSGQSFVILKNEEESVEQQIYRIEQRINEERERGANAQNNVTSATKSAAAATEELEEKERKALIELGLIEDTSKRAFGGSTNQAIRRQFSEYDNLSEAIRRVFGLQRDMIAIMNGGTNSLKGMNETLKALRQSYDSLSDADRKSARGLELRKSIQDLERSVGKLRQELSRPINLKSALGLSENTLDDIAYKMRQLASYRSGLDVNKQAGEIKQVSNELDRLRKKQDELIGTNNRLTQSNNALSRSWNYMKNRLAFYFTVGASTQFVKNLIDIRSQYEMTERSIGILIDSAERGTQIFNELSQMALVSPYTLIELSNAAKQLVAYDIAAKDVVDTTRRLADMAAAVGIPMERLTYALGQIKSYGYLNARDNRMFANAGIPLTKQLADYYTQLEGRLVSTADVYDRIKNKAVGYNDVMSVINKMTDEGGKFFDFQAKMAGTLKVQLANLTLAWNNMLNDIGKSNQELLTVPIAGLKELFLQWRNINRILTTLLITFGGLKTAQLLMNVAFGKGTMSALKEAAAIETSTAATYENILSKSKLNAAQAKFLIATNRSNAELRKAIVNMGVLSASEAKAAATTTGFRGIWFRMWTGSATLLTGAVRGIKAVGAAMWSLATNPVFIAMTALSAITDLFLQWRQNQEAIRDLNNGIANSANEAADSIHKFKKENTDFANAALGGGNVAEMEKAWEAIKEELESSALSVKYFMSELNSIPDAGERVKAAFDIAGRIEQAQLALSKLDETAIQVNNDVAWGLFGEGLAEDLQDYSDKFNKFVSTATTGFKNQAISNILKDDLDEAESEIEKFAQSAGRAIEITLGPDGIKDKVKVGEAIERIKQEMKLKNPEISGAAAQLFDVKLDQIFAKQFAGVYDNTTSLWNILMDEIKSKSSSAFQGITDDIYDENHSWSEDQKRAIDNAVEHLKATLPVEFHNVLNEMTRDLNSREFRIHIGYTFDAPKLDALTSDFNRQFLRMTGPLSNNEYAKRQQQYARFNRKDGETTLEWQKRLADERKKNNELLEQSTSIIKKTTGVVKEQAEETKNTTAGIISTIDEIAKYEGFDVLGKTSGGKKTGKSGGKGSKPEDLVAKALKDELSLIKEMQSNYDKLRKAGVDATSALDIASSGYEETLKRINSVLTKYGISPFNASDFVGKDAINPQSLLDALVNQRQTLLSSGKVKTSSLKDLDVEIQRLNVEAKVYNMERVTKGLNSELDKLKDEYELGVELDANPALGDIFAAMMGIPSDMVNELPKDIDDAARLAQTAIKNSLGDAFSNFDVYANVNKDFLKKWFADNAIDAESELAKQITAIIDWLNDIRVKETKKQIDEWDKLLEKYAEVAQKHKKIDEDAAKERETARKQNAPQWIFDAIDTKALRQHADVDFTEFQKSPDWVLATGNLSNLSSKALGLLIQKLEEYKRSATNLDPKQIERINKTLRNLRKEMRKNNPFSAISDAIDEGMANSAVFDETLVSLEGKIKDMGVNYENLTEEEKAQLEDLIKEWERLVNLQEEASKPSAEKIVGIIGDWASKIQSAANGIKSIGEAIGSEALTKTADALGDVAGNVQAAAEGYKTWGGWWGAVIGGVTDGLPKIIKWLSGDNGITEKVKDSELEVKKLENAYKSLEHTINKMYGEARYGAEQLAVANKKLQLAELERQLALEKSRKKKNQDESKILDLEGSIIDLKNEINDSINAIANDMLGISSVGDAAENLVSSMIEAFKNGEDWMKSYDETFESMIDNMIMKAIVGKVIGQRIQQIFDYVDSISSSEKQGVADQLAELTRQRERIQSAIATAESKLNSTTIDSAQRSVISKVLDQLKQQENNLNSQIALLTQQYNELGQITPENVDYLRELISSERDATKRDFEFYADLFGLRFGQNKESANLSALQQGIQGITEDTAGALEAYMNSVSQQVYLHSDLLFQIRDAVVAMDGDIQLATNAQMLLQLQQSYQVQMAIQTILVGWSNPSGSAVKVELLN